MIGNFATAILAQHYSAPVHNSGLAEPGRLEHAEPLWLDEHQGLNPRIAGPPLPGPNQDRSYHAPRRASNPETVGKRSPGLDERESRPTGGCLPLPIGQLDLRPACFASGCALMLSLKYSPDRQRDCDSRHSRGPFDLFRHPQTLPRRFRAAPRNSGLGRRSIAERFAVWSITSPHHRMASGARIESCCP